MSMPIPQRNSLVEETVRVIRMRIEDGEWKGWLAGERQLTRILEVGRDTVRSALVKLEESGVITSASQGRKRRIIGVGKPEGRVVGEKRLKVGFLSPLPMERLNTSMLFEILRIRESLEARNAQLRFLSGAWVGWPNCEEKLAELVAHEECDFWILYRTPKAVQAWFGRAGTPAMVRGQAHDGVKLPQFDVDWEATARHAGSMLWRKGHRHVAMIVTDMALKGSQAAVRGISSIGESDWNVHVLDDRSDSAVVVEELGRLLAERPEITAVVATRPRQVLTTLTWLGSRKISVPETISILCLASESYLKQTWPPISHYRADPEVVARKVVRAIGRLLQGRGLTDSSAWMFPDEVQGGTIADARPLH